MYHVRALDNAKSKDIDVNQKSIKSMWRFDQSSPSFLITPHKVSSILGVTTQTLAAWRCTGKYNLKFVKIGSKVMYRLEDVETESPLVS